MKLISFDVETSGTLPEYALQPFRARTGDAWLTSVAWHTTEEELDLGNRLNWDRDPNLDDVRHILKTCAEKNVRIVAWNAPFDVAWLIALGLRKEVMACKWLDAMLLYKHTHNRPTFEMGKMSYGLKAAVAVFYPQHANYQEDVDFHATDPTSLHTLRKYNKKDAVFTHGLAQMFWRNLNNQQRRAAILEAECIPLVADTMVDGLAVDRAATTQLDDTLMKRIKAAVVRLKLAHDPSITEEVLNSPKQLSKKLFQDWGLHPVFYTETGAPSTDRKALLKLSLENEAAGIINEYRECNGNRTKFAANTLESIDYNGDECTRPNARIFGTYCVPGGVEVLTRDGWQRLDQWQGSDIMQYNPADRSLSFKRADRFVGPEVSSWVRIKHRNLSCDFTHGHTIPVVSQKYHKHKTIKAGELLDGRSTYDIPLSGWFADKKIDDYAARVLVAVQADGHWGKDGRLKFTFVKQRKKDRIRQLLRNAGVKFREYVCAKYPDRTEFTIYKSNIPYWLTQDRKVFGAWVLEADPEVFMDELVHWDGSPHKDGGFKHTSKLRENAEWVKTVASLANRKCGLSFSCDMYSCHVSDANQRAVASVKPHIHVSEQNYTSRAYCATTVTGFWLARSNGTVFITGNTGRMTYSSKQGRGKETRQTGIALHQWKRDPEFRKTIKAPDGYKLLEFDFAGQEFRWMAIAANDKTMLGLCEPGQDAHAYMGARINQLEYAELRRRLAAGDKEAKSMRQLGKVANLSLQYRTSAQRLREVATYQYDLDMSESEARAIHGTYQLTYYNVPRYWRKQIAWVRAHKYVDNMLGRRVLFQNLSHTGTVRQQNIPWEYASTAINYPIQSMGAEQKYLALAILKNHLNTYDAKFYFELHDGLFIIVPDDKAEKAVHELKKVLSHLPYEQAWRLPLPIGFPVDAKIGPSWGELTEI